MKLHIAALALALAAAAPANAVQDQSKPAPWLVAQTDRKMPSCRLDERNVPVGSTTCRERFTHVCTARGTWERTNKPC
jgi:hypothetical protein